jgi:hypothetical protein
VASSPRDPVSVHIGGAERGLNPRKERPAAMSFRESERARWTEREGPVRVMLTILSPKL